MLPFTDNLTLTLLFVLALFSVFAWCVRRGIVAARETVWIGAALGFFAVSVVFNTALRRNLPVYGGNMRTLLGTTALMTLPLLLAVAYGVYALARSVTPKTLATVTADDCTLHLVRGSLASVKADALIFPARTDGRMTTGEAAALRAFAGADIERGAISRAPLGLGSAAITPAGRLPATYLIHASVFAPAHPAKDAAVKRALAAAFRLAKKHKSRHVALSAFAAAPAGLRPALAAPLVMEAVLRAHADFDAITIAVFDRRALAAFQAEFTALQP